MAVLQATDPSLFSVALYTGEIRTIRRLVVKDPIRQRLVILVKDNGQPPLSATVSIILSVVDSVPASLPDFGDLALSPQYRSNLTLFLIVSLGAISFTFLVAIIVLATIKRYRDRRSIRGYHFSLSGCCGFRSEESTADVFKKSNLNAQITGTKGSTSVEANGNSPLSQPYCYNMCLTPESFKSDFMFLNPCSQITATPQKNNAKGAAYRTSGWSAQEHRNLVNNGVTTPKEVKQANRDWTMTKNQRNSVQKSYRSANMERTLPRRPKSNPESFSSPVAPQYYTWGSHMHADCKASSYIGGLKGVGSVGSGGTPNRSWTLRYTQPPSAQPSPDYQHNVYIPGTSSGYCPMKSAPRGELDVYNSFSTFGKKSLISNYDPSLDQKEDSLINNDYFK
ncbi:hypothetical protein DPEC_G00237290 [Dallia pectoralis]|uniref:Uncharacterized protein n=1 Tax=Dallia pectoralis TaxID=75939 RepID=A0ACC2FYE3_DALPE|nr:hypothetical protein DPEC_G00237290 [Dallia pectoralis]